MQQTSRDPEGTMSYVTATGSLYLKVPQGWKEIQVLSQTGETSVQQQNETFDTLKLSPFNLRCPAARQSDLRLQQHRSTRRGERCRISPLHHAPFESCAPRADYLSA